MDTTAKHEFAILAPVPLEHLESGKDIAATNGFVAFGSNKWDLFRQIDALRQGRRVPVLIYPSHEDVPGKLTFIVCWSGWYIGHVESKGGAHPEGMKHRPPTTLQYSSDNLGHWAVFWHVEGLHELSKYQRLKISEIETYRGGKWRKNAPPRGPELVSLPAGFGVASV